MAGNTVCQAAVVASQPSVLTVFAWYSGRSCTPVNSAVSICTFNIGDLAAGTTSTITFASTVDDPLPAGITEISNTVFITDDGNNGADPNPSDNQASDTTPIVLPTPTPEPTATSTPTPEPTPTYHTLTIEKAGTGTGLVTGDGITCGAECTKSFENETIVVLEAIADADSVFKGWSGAECSGTGYCTITIMADTTVTATFSRISNTPTPTPTPPGPIPTPATPIPEPTTFLLLGFGLLGLLGLGSRLWRKRKK